MRDVQDAIKKFRFLALACCTVFIFGCKSLPIPKADPSPITESSGDVELAMGWFTKTGRDGHKLIWHGGRGFDINAQVIADLNDKSAILIVSTTELPNVHPQTELLKISQKIKDAYKNQFDLPSIL